MPQPAKMHLPVLAESVLDEMSDDSNDTQHTKVDPALLKLPAASLKGTFAKAYKILTEITHQIGWDMLLKYRSSVFVMEEEYRHEKTASITAVRASSAGRASNSSSSHDEDGHNGAEDDEKPAVNGGADETEQHGNGSEKEAVRRDSGDGHMANIIEKPEHSVLPEEVKGGNEQAHTDGKISVQKYTHIQNKRLCERWLDNLFMVLYEVNPPLLLSSSSSSPPSQV